MSRSIFCRLLLALAFLSSSGHCSPSDLPSILIEQLTELFYAEMNNCTLNYGAEAVKNVNKHLEEGLLCLHNIYITQPNAINNLAHIVNSGLTDGHSSVKSIVATLCQTVIKLDVDKCVQPFFTSLKSCTGKEGAEDLDKMGKTFSSLVKYVCQNDGDHIANFVSERGLECLQSKTDKLYQCDSVHNISFGFNQGNVSIFNKESCRQADEERSCIAKELRNCNASTGDFVKGLLDTVINETCSGTSTRQNNIVLSFCFLLILIASLEFPFALFKNEMVC